jgi:DNA repair exonuclease SbcCD ATPase subunit
LSNLYKSGAYGDSSNNYIAALDKMQGTSEQGINDQLARSLASLGEGYTQAQNLTNTGYESLVKALSGYTNPYQGMQAQQPVPVTNALEGILNANNANVGDYQNMLNSEMQMNQANQQNLLSALAQISQSGSQSRSAEAELANQFAQANLGANKANYQGQLQTNASQALTDLANQIAQKKAEAQAQAEQQKFALAQLLAQAGIDVTKLNPPTPPPAGEFDFSNIDLSGLDLSNIGMGIGTL